MYHVGGIGAKICWYVFYFLFLTIKIDKNATENSAGRKIDVQVSSEVEKSKNPSVNTVTEATSAQKRVGNVLSTVERGVIIL